MQRRMPWVLTILLAFLPCFSRQHVKSREKHSNSRLVGSGYDKLAKYLIRQDALLKKALQDLDSEVAVGGRQHYDASGVNNHFLEKSSDTVFTEVQPYSEDFADFDEVPVGEVVSPEATVSESCKCAGTASEGNAGNSDCKTTFKHQPWCYVKKSSACADAKSTDKMPNFDWSFQACAPTKSENPNVETKTDLKHAESTTVESATGHGGCHCAGVKGKDNAGAADCKSTWKSVPWCYVDKTSSCSDKQTSKNLDTHDWSHEACHKVIAEALQAEEAMSKPACECAGVSGEKNAGAADCMSTWKDIPWCYVSKTSGCGDKMKSEKMPSHDWSHEACGHLVKEMEIEMEESLAHDGKSSSSSGCKCAGVSGKHNSGAADCKSTWESKTWCYVEKSAECSDAKSSSKMPKYNWSHLACASESQSSSQKSSSQAAETDVAHHPIPKVSSSCVCADHTIEGKGAADCKSTFDAYGLGLSKAWCYVGKGSGCEDAKKSASHPEEWDWSYTACERSVASAAKAKLAPDEPSLESHKSQVSASADPEPPATHQQSPVGAGTACQCSEAYATGEGANNCETLYEDKPWCYVDASAACSDKQQSRRFPDREWSHLACGQTL